MAVRRFETLDGMRGVAALAVALMHLCGPLNLPASSSAYLAVDFFFMLSGFVIATAYEDRLKAGMTPLAFFWVRVVRLWPLLALGVGLSAAYLGLEIAAGQTQATPGGVVIGAILATFMLPTPPALSPYGWFFLTDYPTWSLAYEMAINIAFAIFAVHLTTRRLIALLAVLGPLLIVGGVYWGWLNRGVTWDGVPLAIVRVSFGFLAGVLLRRIFSGAERRSDLSVVGLAAVLSLALSVGPGRWWFDIPAVLLLFPALILAAAAVEPGPRTRVAAVWLGRTSYAVYVLHVPIGYATIFCLTRMGADPILTVALAMGAVIIASDLADRFWDPRLRRILRSRLLPA